MKKETIFGIFGLVLVFALLFGCIQPNNAEQNSNSTNANANVSANISAKEKPAVSENSSSQITTPISGQTNATPPSTETKPLVEQAAKSDYWFCNFPNQVSNAEAEYRDSRGFIYSTSEYRDPSTYSVTFIPGISYESTNSPLTFSGQPAIISDIHPPDCVPTETKSLKAGESFAVGNYTILFTGLMPRACDSCDMPAQITISSANESYNETILPGMGFRQPFSGNNRIGIQLSQTYWLTETEAVAEIGACEDDGGSAVISTNGQLPVKIVEGQNYCGLIAHLEWANLASRSEPDAIKTIAFVRK